MCAGVMKSGAIGRREGGGKEELSGPEGGYWYGLFCDFFDEEGLFMVTERARALYKNHSCTPEQTKM